MIDAASPEFTESLLSYLPGEVVVLGSSVTVDSSGVIEPSDEVVEAAKASMTLEEKRTLLKKVARSPQFHQALGSLTTAVRDGGLPSIADALGVKVENGGYIPGGGMPLGGGNAVETFVEGIKKHVQQNRK